MSGELFRVKVLRAQRLERGRVLPGSELLCNASTAAALVLDGAAVLVDERDLARLLKAGAPRNGSAWTKPATR